MAHIKANIDLYTDVYGRLVPAGRDARMLVARAGRKVPAAYAHQISEKGNLKSAERAADKAVKPAADKAQKPAVKKPAKRKSTKAKR